MPAGTLPAEKRPQLPRVNGDVWYFQSRPDLTPAAVTITKPDPTASGDIFVAPQIGPLQQGPEIIGPRGGLIWFDPMPTNDAATDFRVQSYQGQPVLTWWQGNETAGVGVGQDIIMNSSYQVIHTISAANGLSADLHEFQLTGRGSALITATFPVVVNATAVGASAAEVVLDSVVQEIDIPTGLVLFQWDSLDHVPLTASYTRPLNVHKKKSKVVKPNSVWTPYDYFHVNSVAADDGGNLLISGRNTWAVYKVNRQTAAIIWTLGGKYSNFKLGPGASFAFQHDVRARASGDALVSMFDDGAGPPYVHSESRALELRLNVAHKTATVLTQLDTRSAGPLELRGQRTGDAGRRRFRRLGGGALLQPVQRAEQAHLRGPLRGRQHQLSRLPLPLERHADHPTRGRSHPPRPQDDRLRELERGDERG